MAKFFFILETALAGAFSFTAFFTLIIQSVNSLGGLMVDIKLSISHQIMASLLGVGFGIMISLTSDKDPKKP